jgi:hypothetical protein
MPDSPLPRHGTRPTRAFALALLTALAPAAPVSAATLDFLFSFTNTVYGGGTVTGRIRGLTDNATSASFSVTVTSNSGGFGTGSHVARPGDNLWTVSGGQITGVVFAAFGSLATPPTGASLAFVVTPVQRSASLANDSDAIFFDAADTPLTFTPIALIPLPATALGLCGALALGALLRRRRSHP